MDVRGNGSRDEFAQYLWGSERPPRPLHQASGFALNSAAAGEGAGAGGAGDLPLGTIFVYPRYLAFLAAREQPADGPGAGASASHSAPLALTARAFARLPDEEKEKLRRPLEDSRSLLIPLGQVAFATHSRWRELPAIELSTSAGQVWLGPHPNATWLNTDWMQSRFAGWEPRLLSTVQSLISGPSQS